MFVICSNDYPHGVMPEGSTDDQTRKVVERLNLEEEKKETYGQMRCYYHYHNVPVVKIPAGEKEPL